MDPILQRRLSKLEFQSPDLILGEILPDVAIILEKSAAGKTLRQRKKNDTLETYQAAFLGFMTRHMAKSLGKVTIAVTGHSPGMQDEEFDCVIKAELGGDAVYRCVQLKQLPPIEVAPEIDLQGMINRFKKSFVFSPDLIVAIWINRDMRLEFETLDFSELQIGQLWLFGDSPSGAITLDGGIVADLQAGLRFQGFMQNGCPQMVPVRFRKR